MAEGRLLAGAAPGQYRVEGALSFATVPAILAESDAAFAGAGALEVDLSSVSVADSAGLALLLLWVQRARAAGRRLAFRNPPASLLGIARLAEVEAMLGAA